MNIKQSMILVFSIFCCATLLGQTDKGLANSTKNNTQTSDSIYTIVEKMPQFPGGERMLLEFISKNLTYNRDSLVQEHTFSAIVRFVVTKDGEIKNVQAIKRKPNSTLAQALVRVIEKMPLWEPGMHEGKTVDVNFYIPLRINPE